VKRYLLEGTNIKEGLVTRFLRSGPCYQIWSSGLNYKYDILSVNRPEVLSGLFHKVLLVQRSPYFTKLKGDTEFLDNVKSIGHCYRCKLFLVCRRATPCYQI